jgi:hypothetical protein
MKITVIKKQALPDDDPEPRTCPWVIEVMGEPVQKK